VEAVRQASRAIPIVFLSVVDPVRQGLVESLAHPGGNSTGFTNFEASMGGKWVEMLKMIAPDVSRVAIMFNPETSPYAELLLRSIEVARSTFSLKDVAIVPVRDANEIEAGMSGIGQGPENGLIVLPDNLTVRHRHPIIAQAARQRLPAVYPFRSFVNDGGLMVYGVEQNDTFRRAGLYVGRILKGTKPADLPVEAPTKFELVINLRTARALGLTVPPWLLAGADAVIE
jgi:putative ABC transport system substrate-binding protein